MRNLALAEISAGQSTRASSITELKKFVHAEVAELEAQIGESSMRDVRQ